MQRSGLEIFLYELLVKIRIFAGSHDRAVLFGFCLSLIPIFPACFFGFVLSAINLALIWSGITRKVEINLAVFGCLIGFVYTLLWIFVIPSVVSSFIPDVGVLRVIEDIRLLIFPGLFSSPSNPSLDV